MKKVYFMVLVLAMLAGASTGFGLNVSPGSISGSAGSSVVMPVYISNSGADMTIDAFSTILEFNSAVLTYSSIDKNGTLTSGFDNISATVNPSNAGQVKLSGVVFSGQPAVVPYGTQNAVLVNVSFTVNQNAATGSTLSLSAFKDDLLNAATTNGMFMLSTGTIPSVTTDSVSSITSTSGVSGGNVTSDGGAPVTARGVCWSTSQNPTISDNKTTDDTGTGSFTSSITGLMPNTTYYVRAYATNSAGTGYGTQISFTTLLEASLPSLAVSLSSVKKTVTCVGNVSSDGGAPVTARGVCWSTSPNPTILNSKTTDGSGTGIFISSITGLMPNTTYYVRGYATNSAGTAYGYEASFKTESDLLEEVGTWTFGPAYKVIKDDARNIVFLSSGGGVYILDVSNPALPQKIGEIKTSADYISGLFYLSGKLYLAVQDEGLRIIDVTTPSNPYELGFYNLQYQYFKKRAKMVVQHD